MILSICEDPKVLEITRLINIFITIIRIIVPIALIFSLMFKLVGAITKSDEDGLSKVKKIAPKNLIAAAIIFLVPTIVRLVVRVTASDISYENCLRVVPVSEIQSAYKNKMEELMLRAEENVNKDNYNAAYKYVKNIKDSDVRQEYEERLAEVKTKIDGGGNLITECDYGDKECEKESSLSGTNKKANIQAKCTGEYEDGYGLAKLNVELISGNATNYNFISSGNSIQNSASSEYKAFNNYTLLIKPKVKIRSSNGEETTIACKVSRTDYVTYRQKGYYFHVRGSQDSDNIINNPMPTNKISYYIHVPDNVSVDDKLPLVLALHGGFGWGVPCNGTTLSEGYQNQHHLKTTFWYKKLGYKINNSDDPDVRAIIIAPSNMSCGWEGSIYNALDIMYAYIKLFNIDIDRIVVTGESQGGYGTLYSGFLEEQLIFTSSENTSLESIASYYDTTVDEIRSFNNKMKLNINYADAGKTIVRAGSKVAVRSKTETDQRSLFSMLVPTSPAKNESRCVFTPSTIYDSDHDCKSSPPYEFKTPIWLISSNDEYAKIQQFAKELTSYYKDKIEIRYTILTGLYDPHSTHIPFFGQTRALEWMTSQVYGNVTLNNNSEIDEIEQSMGKYFVGTFNP